MLTRNSTVLKHISMAGIPAGPAVIRRSGLIRLTIPVIVDMVGKKLLERKAARNESVVQPKLTTMKVVR